MNTPDGKHHIRSDSLDALSEDKILNNGESGLDFDISKLDFISLNQNINDVIGTKRDDHLLFEMYKDGSITQAQFDKGLEERLEKVLGEDVDPSKFARGDFSLPKEHVPEMLAVISAYTGVPLTSFYNSSTGEDDDILAKILEQQKEQKLHKKKLAEQKAEKELLEKQRLLMEAEQAERERIAEQNALDEQNRLKNEALARQNTERIEEKCEPKEEQIKLKSKQSDKDARNEELLVNAQRIADQQHNSFESNIDEAELPDESTDAVELGNEVVTGMSDLSVDTQDEIAGSNEFEYEQFIGEKSELVEEESEIFEKDPLGKDDFTVLVEETSQKQTQEMPRFESSFQDDPIEDMDIEHEIIKGIETDVYSLSTLKTYREESQI